jgi:DNA polymerase
MDAAGAIPDNEKQGIVDLWRKTNPNIKNLWYSYGKAAIKAVKENVIVTLPHGVKFIGAKSMLFIELPSGRRLAYVRPRIIEGKYGEALQYWGTNQETKKWGLVDTYGGKLTENIVQAVARDCLAETLLRLDACGYEVCLHVHDEVIVEVPIDKAEEQLKSICEIMGTEILWAKGLPLNAAGYITKYYKKD